MLPKVFFATPHHGISELKWKDFLYYVLDCNKPSKDVHPTKGMAEQITRSPDSFTNISRDFIHFYKKLGLWSFQEEHAMKALGYAVSALVLAHI